MTFFLHYERYLAKEIYRACVFAALILIALIFVFEFSTIVKWVGKGQFTYGDALRRVMATTMPLFYDTAPVAVLLGSIFALSGLASRSEFVIFRNAGLSAKQLLISLLKIGFPLVLGYFVMGETLVPLGDYYDHYIEITEETLDNPATLEEQIWIKDKSPEGFNRFIYIDRYKADERFYDVTLYEFDMSQFLKRVSHAKSMTWQNNQWQLFDISQKAFISPDLSLATSTNLPPLHMSQWITATNYPTNLIPKRLIYPTRMSVVDLEQLIVYNKKNQLSTRNYLAALLKKLFQPLSLLIMLALALPFAYLPNRQGHIGQKILMGILLGLSYFILNMIFSNLTVISQWPVWLTTIMPSLIFMMIASWQIIRLERPTIPYVRLMHS